MKPFSLLAAFCLAFPAAARAAGSPARDAKAAQLEYLRGMLLERRGDNAEALEAYEKALTADPDSAYITREAAELSLDLGQNEKALGLAKRVVELEPKDAAALILLGRVQWSLGDSDGAERSFQAALKLDPKSSESIFSLGSLVAARSPDKARELLTRFLEQNPAQASEAHFQLAKLEMQQGRGKAAEKHLKDAISLDPDSESLQARYALAQNYEAQHSTEAALAEYAKILRFEPQNVALLAHVAQIHFLQGDWEAMRERLLQAKSAQNDDPTANHWLALYAERKNDWAGAAEYVRASSALKDEPGLNMRLSYYMTQAGNLKEAVEVLEAAHARWPNNDQVAYFLALGYDDLKREADAARLLRRVLELKPESRDARYQLGVILEKTGAMAEAEKEFRALLVDKPDDASVLNYLGYSLVDRGLKLEEAEGYIRRAVALDPRNGAYLDSLGWAHYKQGRSTEAVVDLKKAVDALPLDETVWDHLGDAEAAAGDKAAAWRFWKRAESLVGSGVRLPQKAAKLEKEFHPDDLGAYYLEHLSQLQGGVKKITGLCRLNGKILGRDFSYPCMLNFRSPREMDIDLLGPLFMPVFRIHLGEDGFVMDTLKLEGVDPALVVEAAGKAVGLMRQYLSGDLYASRPARYTKSFWGGRRHIEIPGWRLRLDRGSVRIEGLTSLEAPDYELCLGDFGRTEGREVPRRLTVDGRGFTLGLEFENVKIEFAK